MTELEARLEICRIGKSLFQRAYVHATAGNISVCLDDGILITPTDACLGFLSPEDIVKVDTNGDFAAGLRPSKTLALHRAIYRANKSQAKQAKCVIHTHSSHCVALSLESDANTSSNAKSIGELLPPITPYFVMKVGHVPLVPYHRPGDPAVVPIVEKYIAHYAQKNTPIRAVMLQCLGPNVWADTPAAAMAILEELEETAKLYMWKPNAASLPEHAIDALRQAFGAAW